MSGLPPGLDDFGARLEQAAEREIEGRRRPRRGLRRFGLPVTAALLAAAVSAGAVRLADRGDGRPIAPERGDSAASLKAADDQSIVTRSAAADPHGGPPWVVRPYANAEGADCVQVGQLRDGRLGRRQRGAFRALPRSATGTCAGRDAAEPLIGVQHTNDRTVVFGLAADRDPVIVRVGTRVRRVRPVAFGAFVVVFAGGVDERVEVRSRVRGRETVRTFG